jgi:type VI protein secretion system component VasK
MQVPIAWAKHARHSDAIDPLGCAQIATPAHITRHRKDMLRYLILVIVLLAVLVLIAVVLYYTQGNSVTIEHVSALAPQFVLRA